MSVFTNPSGPSAEQQREYGTAVLGLIESRDPLAVLGQTAGHLGVLIQGLTPEALLKSEAPRKWSITGVVNHLADAELVWGYRLRMVLTADCPSIIGYDQDLWAARCQYEQADIWAAEQQFVAIRRSNLRILGLTTEEDFQRIGIHPARGEQTLRELMKWWAGHDLLHLHQVERIRSAVNVHV